MPPTRPRRAHVRPVFYRQNRPTRRKKLGPEASFIEEDGDVQQEVASPPVERGVERALNIRGKSRTKAIFIRRRRSVHSKVKAEDDAAPTKHTHDLPSLPAPLLPVIRKPLQTHKVATGRRTTTKRKRREKAFLIALKERIDVAFSSANKIKLHPIAILAWLSAEEPLNAELLLDNADILADDDLRQDVDPFFAKELDGLIARFHDCQVPDSQSTQENPFVEVPKDYSMIQTPQLVEGEDYDVFMQEASSGDEDVAKGSVINGARHLKTAQSGFDPVEVLRNHAIQFQNADCPKESNLSSTIHPLFSLNNFHGCPQAIYDTLQPGLRLASLLLTSKATAHFWHTLLYGERTELEHKGDRVYYRIHSTVAWESEVAAKYRTLLSKLSKFLHFNFSMWPTERDKGVWTYGTMHPIRDYKSGYNLKTGDPWRNSRIRLHTDFYIAAKRLSLLKNPDPAQVLRFNFFLAVNLCHEMAHFLVMSGPNTKIIEKQYWPGRTITEHSGEPYMFDQPWKECGYAFETRIFGGLIKPISYRIDCLYGLTTYDEPGINFQGQLCDVRTFYTVPMDYIAEMQQQSSWEEDRIEGKEWDIFHIKRDGARAVNVPLFDLTIWNGEKEPEDMIADEKAKGEVSTPFRRRANGDIVKN